MKKGIVWLFAGFLLAGCFAPESGSKSADPEAYACRAIDSYDYSSAVPYREGVDDSFYDDVLLAGDSRMGSLALYGTHLNAQVEFVTSLNLLLIDTMKLDGVEEDSEMQTLMDVLSTTDKKNIYLLFGINEIRNPNFEAFGEKFQEILTMLKTNRPDAQIYIILAYHPDYISGLPEPQLSEHLKNLNSKLMDLAYNNNVYYLDPDNGMSDEQNTIKDELVWDGLHFNPGGARAFEDYIATHVVRREEYVKEVCE